MDAPRPKATTITSVIDPDLGAVRRFIEEMLARGAVAQAREALRFRFSPRVLARILWAFARS